MNMTIPASLTALLLENAKNLVLQLVSDAAVLGCSLIVGCPIRHLLLLVLGAKVNIAGAA